MDMSVIHQIASQMNSRFDQDIIPRLVEYVKVPAKSPAFDASWSAHGYLQTVVQEAMQWCQSKAPQIKGLKLEIVSIAGRTPCIFFDVPATNGLGEQNTVMFYGHLDKQPEMTGWREDSGPWKPLIEDGKLYGRGAADDGYAIYAAMAIIAAMDAQGIARARCVGIIETCEESGSPDLPAYLEHLLPRLGNVQLVAGLDSGCANYDQLWVTTSLRGLVAGTLTVEILSEGVHSGSASGIVPSSFRIARQLLNRLDDANTGLVLIPELQAAIPHERILQAEQAGAILGDSVWNHFPWVGCSHGDAGVAHAQPVTKEPVEGILNRTWRAALSVVGAAGFPSIDSAGNVLRPSTSLKLSMRLPPTVDGDRAAQAMKKLLETNVPYNAKVSFSGGHGATGWNAPPTAPWLSAALDHASQQVFQKPAAYLGEGGTIPFMNMLGAKFPNAQFLITGLLGPKSNAHGPNEFLHIPYVKKLCTAVASVVAAVPGK